MLATSASPEPRLVARKRVVRLGVLGTSELTIKNLMKESQFYPLDHLVKPDGNWWGDSGPYKSSHRKTYIFSMWHVL